MNRTSTTIAVAASLLLPAALWAQEGPALDTSDGGFSAQSQQQPPEPAASRPQADGAAPAVDTGSSGGGTSVIGDSESPIGLYIIPWRSSSPTPQMDRPARFVDATEEPVDETQFRRFVEYYDALTRHRAAQQGNAGNTGN